jgi:hypothetical protein
MKERGLRSRWTDKVIVLPEGTEDLWSSEYLELVQLARSGDLRDLRHHPIGQIIPQVVVTCGDALLRPAPRTGP